MPLEINPDRLPLHEAYMQMAEVWAKRSKANRKQVGALIVKGDQIISDGYNGMPPDTAPEDEVCEMLNSDGTLSTKPEVIHAEANAILKIAANGGQSCEGATLYVTMSPCENCVSLIRRAKIKNVFYREQYRDMSGIHKLNASGINCKKI